MTTERATNTEILKAVKGINTRIEDHETRLKAVETYKTAQEAVAQYIAQQKPTRRDADTSSFDGKKIAIVFGFFSAVIYLIVQIIQMTNK